VGTTAVRDALGLATVALLLALPSPARACAVCDCGDPTLTAVGVEQPYRNRVRVGLEERYGSHTQGDVASGESLQQLRSSLFGSWTPLTRLTVSVLMPWMTTWLTAGSGRHALINGLADMEVSARVLLARDRKLAPHHLFWALGGLKMPTGPKLHDDAGYPFSPDDQPGSGSWDPFVGATYAWYSGDLWSAYASSSYRYTTEGWNGYRRGMMVGWNAAVQAQPWSFLAMQLTFDGNWLAADRLANGNPLPNTGGTVARMGTAVVGSPRTDLIVKAAVALPVVQELQGQQTDGVQVTLSLIWDIR
jgi:hypothetical protein